MSSPIHSYLFSPPPSPPRRAMDSDPNIGFTGIKSLLVPTDFIPRSPHLDGGLKTRSPRTPQQSKFTLDNVYPSSFPSRSRILDPEATPIATYSTPTTPRRRSYEKTVSSPPYIPSNVPSAPIPIPSSLPKPLIRLLFLASLLLSSILLLVFVPSARLPSLRAAGMSRRLALDPNGKAFIDVEGITSWSDARDKDYRPPQIKAPHMMRRALEEKAAPAPIFGQQADEFMLAHPRASRPALIPRPLPSSHELLALQSYLLSSAYNVIPSHVDPSEPIDANAVLGVGVHKLGPAGGDLEQAWLDELKGEREDEVIVWYGGNGRPNLPHDVLDFLASTHGSSRKPTLIPCHARSDRLALLSILDRLSLPLRDHPIIMIGNKPIVGDLRNLEELRLSGELESMLAEIGWKKEEKSAWKPKYAKVQKRTLTEVEEALKAQVQAAFEEELEDDVS
ncbi:hypothetical protein I204_06775 [Kwoniella mangroviensis CBS 8886]|nr:uncharacterized protein I203_01252 [Kwoniella mangroviensis CBS 8507]OCF69395.1 hypothetical protein I203_01252 [Kwoniella mangroviensis CBS 8507]OCF72396.1 hypothetical protein I204_06775 [Kwoniella mangroviensis CBS 8886]